MGLSGRLPEWGTRAGAPRVCALPSIPSISTWNVDVRAGTPAAPLAQKVTFSTEATHQNSRGRGTLGLREQLPSTRHPYLSSHGHLLQLRAGCPAAPHAHPTDRWDTLRTQGFLRVLVTEAEVPSTSDSAQPSVEGEALLAALPGPFQLESQ